MANLDQIMDYVADKRNAPFEYVRTVPYSTLSTGWPSTNNGFAVFTIEPSNTSNAYANIQDVINKLTDEMLKHAAAMEFEKAAEIRDRIKELENFGDGAKN